MASVSMSERPMEPPRSSTGFETSLRTSWADERGLGRTDGSQIRIGDKLTVSGTLSFVPYDNNCVSSRTIDATAIR